jgi:hypothetical protein
MRSHRVRVRKSKNRMVKEAAVERHSLRGSLFNMGYMAGLCIVISAGFVGAAFGQSRLEISPDGNHVEFDIRDVPRHEAMDDLFAEKGVKIVWNSSATAKETVTGKFSGTFASAVRRLLASTNFVIVYGRNEDKRRISHILVFGPASAGVSPRSARLEVPLQQNSGGASSAVAPAATSRSVAAPPSPATSATDLVMLKASASLSIPTPNSVVIPLPVPTGFMGPLPTPATVDSIRH